MKYPNSDNTSILTPRCLKEKFFFKFLTTTKTDRPFEKIKEHHRFDLLSFICCRYVRRKKMITEIFRLYNYCSVAFSVCK